MAAPKATQCTWSRDAETMTAARSKQQGAPYVPPHRRQLAPLPKTVPKAHRLEMARNTLGPAEPKPMPTSTAPHKARPKPKAPQEPKAASEPKTTPQSEAKSTQCSGPYIPPHRRGATSKADTGVLQGALIQCNSSRIVDLKRNRVESDILEAKTAHDDKVRKLKDIADELTAIRRRPEGMSARLKRDIAAGHSIKMCKRKEASRQRMAMRRARGQAERAKERLELEKK